MTAMGPLSDVKILEFGSIGPGPFAAMVLAGAGANVLRLRRPDEQPLIPVAGTGADKRGRPSVPIDLKDPADQELLLRLVDSADAVIEGFRPGVLERRGLGPDDLLARNPRLVYGRMTGYGQDGPMAQVPGHDINYIAMSGALSAMARQGERPLFPLNLLGDYGGGGMLLAFGVVCAVLDARTTGRGQVVDAAMVDGVAQLATPFYGFAAAGSLGPPGTNFLDSGAHFYEVYETADGGHMAVGAIEPQFYGALLRILDIPDSEAPQWDRQRWPELKRRFSAVFRTRTRDEWTAVFELADACTTPVLSLEEATVHPHNVARRTFVERDGAMLPSAAPRFGTSSDDRTPAVDTQALASTWGLDEAELAALDPS